MSWEKNNKWKLFVLTKPTKINENDRVMSLVLDFVSVVKYVNTTSLFTEMWYVYITVSQLPSKSYMLVL